jgi:glutamate synthase (NADPH/NADH) large chain
MHALRAVHGRLSRPGHRAGGATGSGSFQVGMGLAEKPGTCSVSITASARRPIRPSPASAAACATWSARTGHPPSGAMSPTSSAPQQRGRGPPQARRTQERPPGACSRDQVQSHFHAHDPALDAGRHDFELRTLLGRILPPERLSGPSRRTAGFPPCGDLPPHPSAAVLRGPLAEHVEGLQMGVCLPNEEKGHARAHLHG